MVRRSSMLCNNCCGFHVCKPTDSKQLNRFPMARAPKRRSTWPRSNKASERTGSLTNGSFDKPQLGPLPPAPDADDSSRNFLCPSIAPKHGLAPLALLRSNIQLGRVGGKRVTKLTKRGENSQNRNKTSPDSWIGYGGWASSEEEEGAE